MDAKGHHGIKTDNGMDALYEYLEKEYEHTIFVPNIDDLCTQYIEVETIQEACSLLDIEYNHNDWESSLKELKEKTVIIDSEPDNLIVKTNFKRIEP